MNLDTLKYAREQATKRQQERKASGLSCYLTPIEKLTQHPTPMRAIAAKCWQCEGEDADPDVKWRIGNCEINDCALHSFRPYQKLFGKPIPSSLCL